VLAIAASLSKTLQRKVNQSLSDVRNSKNVAGRRSTTVSRFALWLYGRAVVQFAGPQLALILLIDVRPFRRNSEGARHDCVIAGRSPERQFMSRWHRMQSARSARAWDSVRFPSSRSRCYTPGRPRCQRWQRLGWRWGGGVTHAGPFLGKNDETRPIWLTDPIPSLSPRICAFITVHLGDT
jgi:hypothetical protein